MMIARLPCLLRWALVAAVALSSGACRKPAPDEVVNTRRTPTTKIPVPPAGTGGTSATTGVGGSGGTGGAGTGGSAGAGGTGADPTTPFSKARLLEAVADCAMDRYREFQSLASMLDDKAHGPGLVAADFVALREAWLVVMAKWQEVELFRFGPMARGVDPGGQDIRDQVYGWPLVYRCGIEEQLVSRGYNAPEFGASLINVRGLAAFEYVTFYEGSDNACSPFSTINAHGTWAALGARELAQRKLEYAAAVSRDVALHAGALVAAWAPMGGNFRAQLLGAGAGSAIFTSEQKALNAVSDALFYIELEAKDWKLGRPLGLGDCGAPSCPEELESLYARQSTAHLAHNLTGFRMLFQGCQPGYGGFGFDDWLRAVGASDLADQMLAALTAAEQAVRALDPPLEQALTTDPDKVMNVYTSFKALTDLLKTDFVTVLNLELPKPTQGDTD
jgi:predicted lipoprotein